MTTTNASLNLISGSLAIGDGSSSIGSATIGAGATLSVAAGASFTLQANQALTDDGTVTFASGDTVTVVASQGTGQIVVNGALSATSATFAQSNYYGTTQLVVNSGGHLKATGSAFGLNNLQLAPGNVFNPGDLANDVFNLPIYVPYNDVALLSGAGNNNQSFQQINIDPTTLPSGQTLALNEIGTSSTANLSYNFPSGFTVASGATLAVGPNVPLQVAANQALTDDGTVTFASGDTVTVVASQGTGQIVVNGALSATSATFAQSNYYGTTQLVVNSGGHLKATGSAFGLNNLQLAPGNVFNPGDLANDVFNLPIYVPYNDVALLSGAGNNNQSFQQINIDPTTLPSGQTLALNEIGTSSTASLSYNFPSGFTVASGATLAVGPNVPLQVAANQALTDDGTVTFASGDTVTVVASQGTGQIVVNGALSATSATFAQSNYYGTTQLVVNSGGHLKATGSAFGLNNLQLAPGNVFNPGDLANDVFNLPIYVPYNDVALLSGAGNNNQSFQQINIDPTTLPSGQTLALNEIGTSSTANLSYNFPSGFTVASGATLAVGPNVPLQVAANQALTDDGTVTFASGDTVTVVASQGTGQIVVNGALSATSATFAQSNYYGTTQLVVNSGGHLKATGSAFGLNNLQLAPGNVFNPGDLANDVFNLPIYVPYNDVALLSGAGNNNQSFQQINIDPTTLPSGQTLALNEIGTSSTANLSYNFPSGFTVASGATLAVGPNVPLQVAANQALTDDGTVTFASGDTVTVVASQGTGQIVVNGALSATSATFAQSNYYGTTQLVVNSGGHLMATGSAFGLNNLQLAPGNVFNPGDLANDVFNLPIYVPYNDAALLAGEGNNSQSFQPIYIVAGTMPSGTSVTLASLGINSNLAYIFAGTFYVGAGSQLIIGPGADVIIASGQTVKVDGTLAVQPNAYLTFYDQNNGATEGVVVDSGGLMTVSGATIGRTNGANANDNSRITVMPSGSLIASNSIFQFDNLYLDPSSIDQLAVDVLATQLSIDSGISGSVTNSDFTSGNVVATGNPTPTINLGNNYWGTTNTNSIDAKITYSSSETTPVQISPVLSAASAAGMATTVVASDVSATYNANASQVLSLKAAVTTSAGNATGGTVLFTVLNGTSIVGNPVTGTVANGIATASYQLPSGEPGGNYTIQVIYYGTGNFIGSMESAHFVTVSAAATTTTGSSKTVSFSTASQAVQLSAAVGSPAGTVREGSVTFTLLNNGNPVGLAAAANVVNGVATASYILPANSPAGTYIITATYSGTNDYAVSSDSSHTLTVAGTTTTTATNASATYSASADLVTLNATFASPSGTVNGGAATFTVLSGSTTVGSAMQAVVSNGAASVSYNLPAGTPAGTYEILVSYAGTTSLLASSDPSHSLTILEAATTTTAMNASATYSASADLVTLNATFASPSGTVNGGAATFTVLSGSTTVGSAMQAVVSNGAASVSYNLPAGTAAGTYEILVSYAGTTNLLASSDSSHTLTITSSNVTTPTVADPSFEADSVGAKNFVYDPTGSPWTFSGSKGNGSGLASNGSALTSANPAAPDGAQVAFIQEKGSITQTVANWAAGSYTISFDAAQRNYGVEVENFEVLVDGTVVGTFKPTSTSYLMYTTPAFSVAAGAHTIEFLGLDSAGGDNTALIDVVSVASSAPPSPPTISPNDSSFEADSVGAKNFVYDPTGSPWTFSGSKGNGSGLASNGSALTSANPAAPDGAQVAFIQEKGSITQTVASWQAGSYAISFDAAQRNYGVEVENFEVLVDGTVVGTFKPTSASYLMYTTPAFSVAAGAHTIEFLGLDSAGGDNTALIDNVAIASAQ